jgi:hypothetical protein
VLVVVLVLGILISEQEEKETENRGRGRARLRGAEPHLAGVVAQVVIKQIVPGRFMDLA